MNTSKYLYILLVILALGCNSDDPTTIEYSDNIFGGQNTTVQFKELSSTSNEFEDVLLVPLEIGIPSVNDSTFVTVSWGSGDSSDFENFTSKVIAFPPSFNVNQNVELTISKDDFYEDTENFQIKISEVSGGLNSIIGPKSTHDITLSYIFKDYLAEYAIDIDQLAGFKIENGLEKRVRTYENVPPRSIDDLNNTALHDEMIDYFQLIIPAEYQTRIVEFLAFKGFFGKELSENSTGTLGYVFPVTQELNKWRLALDSNHAISVNGEFDNDLEFTYTCIHENTHLFTLNETQFDTSNNCSGNFEMNGGCAQNSSYLQQFINEFFTPTLLSQMGTSGFYTTYSDQFVTEYASSHVSEDIAESFSYFVLKDQFTNFNEFGEIAKAKVNWFNNFPELVTLKNHILEKAASIDRQSTTTRNGALRANSFDKITIKRPQMHSCGLHIKND